MSDTVLLERTGAVAVDHAEPPRGHEHPGRRDEDRAARGGRARSRDDDAVRAVVLTGAGRAFCVGQDLREHATLLEAGDPAPLSTVREHYNPVVTALARCPSRSSPRSTARPPAPGLGLACACDFRIGAAGARFTTAFTGIGLTADSGLSWTLPRLVGAGRADRAAAARRAVHDRAGARDGACSTRSSPPEAVLPAARRAGRAAGRRARRRRTPALKASLRFAADSSLVEALAEEDRQQTLRRRARRTTPPRSGRSSPSRRRCSRAGEDASHRRAHRARRVAVRRRRAGSPPAFPRSCRCCPRHAARSDHSTKIDAAGDRPPPPLPAIMLLSPSTRRAGRQHQEDQRGNGSLRPPAPAITPLLPSTRRAQRQHQGDQRSGGSLRPPRGAPGDPARPTGRSGAATAARRTRTPAGRAASPAGPSRPSGRSRSSRQTNTDDAGPPASTAKVPVPRTRRPVCRTWHRRGGSHRSMTIVSRNPSGPTPVNASMPPPTPDAALRGALARGCRASRSPCASQSTAPAQTSRGGGLRRATRSTRVAVMPAASRTLPPGRQPGVSRAGAPTPAATAAGDRGAAHGRRRRRPRRARSPAPRAAHARPAGTRHVPPAASGCVGGAHRLVGVDRLGERHRRPAAPRRAACARRAAARRPRRSRARAPRAARSPARSRQRRARCRLGPAGSSSTAPAGRSTDSGAGRRHAARAPALPPAAGRPPSAASPGGRARSRVHLAAQRGELLVALEQLARRAGRAPRRPRHPVAAQAPSQKRSRARSPAVTRPASGSARSARSGGASTSTASSRSGHAPRRRTARRARRAHRAPSSSGTVVTGTILPDRTVPTAPSGHSRAVTVPDPPTAGPTSSTSTSRSPPTCPRAAQRQRRAGADARPVDDLAPPARPGPPLDAQAGRHHPGRAGPPARPAHRRAGRGGRASRSSGSRPTG